MNGRITASARWQSFLKVRLRYGCHRTTACRTTRRERRAPEAERSVAQVTHREGLQRLLSTQNSRLDFRSPKLTRAWCMEAV